MTASNIPGDRSADRAIGRYTMGLGDDSLILSQRLGEWSGHAPSLELDLSLSNIALDLVGQAQLFLDYAADLTGQADADALAFHRDVMDFRNCLLVEQPNGDFGQTIARQFLFSTQQELLLEALARGADPRLASIAAKSAKEVAYHASFACEWVVRLGDGTEESRQRMAAGLEWCWRFVDEMFEPDGEAQTGFEPPDPQAFRPAWDQRVDAVLTQAGLQRPPARRAVTGGRHGRHSEHLGHMLSEMQFLQRAYPGATW